MSTVVAYLACWMNKMRGITTPLMWSISFLMYGRPRRTTHEANERWPIKDWHWRNVRDFFRENSCKSEQSCCNLSKGRWAWPATVSISIPWTDSCVVGKTVLDSLIGIPASRAIWRKDCSCNSHKGELGGAINMKLSKIWDSEWKLKFF